jgi:hypothetical protein
VTPVDPVVAGVEVGDGRRRVSRKGLWSEIGRSLANVTQESITGSLSGVVDTYADTIALEQAAVPHIRKTGEVYRIFVSPVRAVDGFPQMRAVEPAGHVPQLPGSRTRVQGDAVVERRRHRAASAVEI